MARRQTKQQNNLKPSSRSGWLKSVGAVLIFFSWMSQNYLQKEGQDKTRHLEFSQQLIMIEEGHLNQWFTLYLTESLSQNPRTEILNAAALHSCMHAINLLSWGEARMEDDSQKAVTLIKRKREITKQAQEFYVKNDTESLRKLLNQLIQEQNERGPGIIARADQALLEARNKDKIANQLFLLLYIIGSGCVGLGFLWAKRDMVKSA